MFTRKDVLISDNVSVINDAITARKPVITQNSHLLPELEVDCVVEGTGVPEVGAEVALRCIQGGKHIIMLNVEADVVIGPASSPLLPTRLTSVVPVDMNVPTSIRG